MYITELLSRRAQCSVVHSTLLTVYVLSFLRIREQYAAFDLSAVRLRDSQGNNGEGGERTLHVERFGTRPKSHDA